MGEGSGMPMYTFNCGNCHEEFTRLVGLDRKDQVTCPLCGGKDLKQVFRRFNYVKITEKYNPECRNALNCASAERYGCGKYAKDPVPLIPD
jgi:putative FmdB family regulatory protein